MEKKDEELIQSLLSHDPDLNRYYQEHADLEAKLAKLNRKAYLTPDQDRERRELQKRKLHGKDRIMEILDRHRSAGSGAGAA